MVHQSSYSSIHMPCGHVYVGALLFGKSCEGRHHIWRIPNAATTGLRTSDRIRARRMRLERGMRNAYLWNYAPVLGNSVSIIKEAKVDKTNKVLKKKCRGNN
jgi:hypothetical protein